MDSLEVQGESKGKRGVNPCLPLGRASRASQEESEAPGSFGLAGANWDLLSNTQISTKKQTKKQNKVKNWKDSYSIEILSYIIILTQRM